MKTDPCNEIPIEVLVDYADNELPADERERLSEHLTKCEHCRARLEDLERSLHVTQLIWRDVEEQIGRGYTTAKPRSRAFPSAWRVAIAASVLLVVTGFLVRHFTRQQGRQVVPGPVQHVTLEEIEDRIRRAGLAAQLFATAEILDRLEGGQAAAEEQYVYITEYYSDTEQAAQARRRLEERSEP